MNRSVISRASGGMVAEKRPTWMFEGMAWKTSYIWSLKPRESISSASSRTNDLIVAGLKPRRERRSSTRPGVPTMMWTPFWRMAISYNKLWKYGKRSIRKKKAREIKRWVSILAKSRIVMFIVDHMGKEILLIPIEKKQKKKDTSNRKRRRGVPSRTRVPPIAA